MNYNHSSNSMAFYDNLRFGIVERAVKDYEEALKINDAAAIKELERFFASSWCDALLGNIDGLGKKVQRLVKETVKKGKIKNDSAQNDLRRSIERITTQNQHNARRKKFFG